MHAPWSIHKHSVHYTNAPWSTQTQCALHKCTLVYTACTTPTQRALHNHSVHFHKHSVHFTNTACTFTNTACTFTNTACTFTNTACTFTNTACTTSMHLGLYTNTVCTTPMHLNLYTNTACTRSILTCERVSVTIHIGTQVLI